MYASKVGTGFTDATLTRLAALMRPLERETSPFDVGLDKTVSLVDGVDYRGKFMCAPCLVKQTVETWGTAVYTRGQIERALDGVFRSPGALRRLHAFVCDRCGKTTPCLTATPARSGLSA